MIQPGIGPCKVHRCSRIVGDNGTASNVITGASYGPSSELLSMTGAVTESRTYNLMLRSSRRPTTSAANGSAKEEAP